MRFGKIEYLNLLPFDVCVKGYPLISSAKLFIRLKKSYPARLNIDFKKKRIDGGFISSFVAQKAHRIKKTCKSGIISHGAVWSVILKQGEGFDYQSATSNALKMVLGLKGEVLIGDRALVHKKSGEAYKDLGILWSEKTHLPFVYGYLCFNRYGNLIKSISKKFNKKFGTKKKKIPYYILQDASKRTGLEKDFIEEYLEHIFYVIGVKERLGLERFYRYVRLKRIH